MLTSIIILTYNKLDYTKKCIDSIRKYTAKDSYEIIVVDNNSTDETVKWLKSQKDIRVIYNNENLGFPKGCNQGIEISQGDNILLLNNDVVVTHNWLTNLIECLYSSVDIGAVGPVTNYCSNIQTISTNYSNLDEMQGFAKQYNISNSSQWEERLRLIGFCFLIKKEVVEKVGLLDEIFTPGNYEDDDYSLRIRKIGYRLVLCKDTFIHHFGNVTFSSMSNKYNDLITTNRMKFIDKWGIEPEYFMRVRKDFTLTIKKTCNSFPNVLHIDCGAGGTLLDIKNKIPDANLYGIESNSNAVISTEHFAKINIGENENIKRYKENFFDFIIFTLTIRNIDYYFEMFKNIKKYLKKSGNILFILPKGFNVKNEVINKELGKIFNNFSYKVYKTYHDEVMHLKIEKERMLNNKKICFVCCVNDEKMYAKSLSYIKKLEIPKEYEIEFICKQNAEFITKAYNEAINNTDAKYKIYMHQDVFITNKHFLKDVLDIFQNKEIGMIGVAGSKDVPPNGIWWESSKTYGKVFENHTGEFQLLSFNQPKNNYESVSMIDGLIMITQYDIHWRDDIFDGWHFYDVSQSLEFIKAGYEVVVPKQGFPWCIHDCGAMYVDSVYEKYREIFIKEYLKEPDKTDKLDKAEVSPRFVTIMPGIKNVHLTKDVGMIPYILHKYFGYDSRIVVYEGGNFPYINNEVKGLKLEYIKSSGNSILDGYNYLINNARNIDILQLYHLTDRTFNWIKIYKKMNPKGKIFLKLDSNNSIRNINYNNSFDKNTKSLIEQCDLVSVETTELYEHLSKTWPIEVHYIPNGFYNFNYGENYVKYEEKENIICTAGRLGTYVKATEILMQAFANASDNIKDWKLKLIGPIDESFNRYIQEYFAKYPNLKDKVIFTGKISDRSKLYDEYKKAKVFCLPSRWEGFPLVLPEAISKGCYIIISSIEPSKDITNSGKYGSVFQINSVEQLSKLLIEKCNNESMLKRVCNEIQDYAYDNFYWVKICEKINKLL